MSVDAAWAAGREPEPPMDLSAWFGAESGGEPVEALLASGLGALKLASSRPGRVREAAFDLLAADALLTYASEAALEAADPAQTLRALLRSVAEAR